MASSLRLRAKSLFTPDPTEFFAFLQHLFSRETVPRAVARHVFDAAQKEFPDSLVVCLLTHLQKSPVKNTRSRCAILLLRLFRRQHNLYHRLSPTAQNELKTVLLHCMRQESVAVIYRALIDIVADTATLLLPKKQWPEVYEYMFQSLKTDDPRDVECAALLFTKLIPRFPQLFLFHVNDLSEAFLGIMDTTWDSPVVSGAAVGASVELILHLTTPSNHEKHYDLVNYMLRVLFDVMDEIDACFSTHRILEDMAVLAGAETRFLRSNIDYLVEKMLDAAENYFASNKTKELAVECVITIAEDREYGCGMIQNTPLDVLRRLFRVLLYMLAPIDLDPSEDEGDSGNCSYAMKAIARLVKALRENVVIHSIPDCLNNFLQDLDWRRRQAAITFLGLIVDSFSKKGNSRLKEAALMSLASLADSFQAWSRLCKYLGTEFVPYLSLSMPQLLLSAQLTNYLDIIENSDDMDYSDDERLVFLQKS
ncbi:hypothetical protein DH2020_046324 [Rehmannia glutinosa]|uniref:IPO4/5-like TPR repeats domain-containing protein n=1 Tax=Rehmannia glutinosa TaxID=99300 RepID=A0ABR0UBS2_REHGL